MADALIDTGFYNEVAIARTIGQHYNPGQDAWTIIACYNFAATDGSEGTACLDSFTAIQLDNGVWVVGATVNGVYRWRAIGLTADANDFGQAAVPPAPPSDGTPQQQPEQPSQERPAPEEGEAAPAND
ncbi:MAG: hypothetical protein WD448_07835 [Woeseia sp.]